MRIITDSPLDRLLRALPDVGALSPLRDALLGVSVPDVARAWAASSAYTTYDKRLVGGELIGAAVRESAETARQRLDELYAGTERALRSIASGNDAAAADELLSLGGAAEAAEAWREALACYEAALRIAEPLGVPALVGAALRRAARVRLSLGEAEVAFELYRRGLERADLIGDDDGRVIALTGLGNVRSSQGRWSEARTHYGAALAICERQSASMRCAQLYLNLANLCREEGRLDESAAWLERVLPLWDEIGASNQTIWFNNRGLELIQCGELEQAEAAFRQAADRAPGHFERAMVLENLSDLALRGGRLDDAERLARSAEEEALAAGSPWALGLVYIALGKVFRERRDGNGVTFFEKALEISRERRYPLIEGIACLEYGIYRRELGGAEEARLFLARSCDLFRAMGGGPDLNRAEQELAGIPFPEA